LRSALRHADWFARQGDKVLLAGRKIENHHKRMCELLLSRTALLPTSAHPDTVQWSSKFREETTKRKAPSTSGTKGECEDFFVWRSVLLLAELIRYNHSGLTHVPSASQHTTFSYPKVPLIGTLLSKIPIATTLQVTWRPKCRIIHSILLSNSLKPNQVAS